MSRAFTSEEYEEKEVPVYVPDEIMIGDDHDLVLRYSRGRSINDPLLPYEIGVHFLKGDGGFFQSDEFAVKWLKMAVDMGLADAMVALAEFYLADTKKYGYREAANLLSQALSLGSAEASARLDKALVGDPASKRTFTTYRLNAELGDVDSYISLAEGFEKGLFGKDRAKAAAIWYVRAFRKGRTDAGKRALALHYRKKAVLSDEELAELRS